MLQNDPLKEYAARGTFIFPADTAVRLAVDTIEFLTSNFPNWEPIEFCGYHFRDAGATAVQEIAFSTANGLAYLDTAQERGVDIGTLAPHLFLFLNANIDVFEEAAKFRAARRLWAKLLHGRYGVPRDVARMNIFAYTSGAMLWAQEPMNNVVRVTLETLGAALGGVQTLATTSYDEALGLPTESAAHLALRTQQIVAYESGAAKVADPLGGSRYVEDLTIRLESQIAELLIEIVELGSWGARWQRWILGSFRITSPRPHTRRSSKSKTDRGLSSASTSMALRRMSSRNRSSSPMESRQRSSNACGYSVTSATRGQSTMLSKHSTLRHGRVTTSCQP
jgi:methylmalonyl-CoA mutase N-terminal domain/subunit